jgi:hypothetical protein
LGNGTTTPSSVPVVVRGLTGVIDLAAHAGHACALLVNGTGDCWGENRFGDLGNGTTTNASAPVGVAGLAHAIGISAGDHHSCAWLADGVARCWGLDGRGQLGNGKTSNATIPVTVSDVAPQTKIVVPDPGAHLRGNVTLDATASDDVGIATVEFHVTGGALVDSRLGTATNSSFGWLFDWNTRTVPDGTYTLRSVAYDGTGKVTASAPVSVTVDNAQ